MYCKCNKCRYPNQHCTYYHQCGACKKFGHGQIECPKNNNNNPQLMLNLLAYSNNNDSIRSEKHCTISYCKQKQSHTTESHNDNYNNNYISQLSEEEIEWFSKHLHPSCQKVVNKYSFITDYYYGVVKNLITYGTNYLGKVYNTSYGGMGNIIYAKRDNLQSLIKVEIHEIQNDNDIYVKKYTSGYQDITKQIQHTMSINSPPEPFPSLLGSGSYDTYNSNYSLV
jgi:hypothetical protein